IVRTDPTAEASLAAIRARSRFGIAMAAMIKMIATTISNSMSEKPFWFFFIVSPRSQAPKLICVVLPGGVRHDLSQGRCQAGRRGLLSRHICAIPILYYDLQPPRRASFSSLARPRRSTLSQVDTSCSWAMTKTAGVLETLGLGRGCCERFRIVLA